MNRHEDLDRMLGNWLDDPLTLPAPEYLPEVLERTRQLRQRRSWASLERWLPMTITLRNPVLPWPTRLLAMSLALLLALLIALTGLPFLAGALVSPAPEDEGANGLLAFDRDGDIYVVEPSAQAEPRLLVGGPTEDIVPIWSPDGERLLFLREEGTTESVMVTDATGAPPVVLNSEPLREIDRVTWSPDSRIVAVASAATPVRAVSLFMADGSGPVGFASRGPDPWLGADMPAWRPAAGDDVPVGLLYRSFELPTRLRLAEAMVSGDPPTKACTEEGTRCAKDDGVVLDDTDIAGGRNETNGWQYDFLYPAWAPDGSRFAYHTLQDLPAYPYDPGFRVHLGRLDEAGTAATDTRVEFDPASNDEFGVGWSPDGLKIVFQALKGDSTRLVIADVSSRDGGISATVATEPLPAPEWDSLSYTWAPNGSQLVAVDVGMPDGTFLVDAETGALHPLSWSADGEPSWQASSDQ